MCFSRSSSLRVRHLLHCCRAVVVTTPSRSQQPHHHSEKDRSNLRCLEGRSVVKVAADRLHEVHVAVHLPRQNVEHQASGNDADECRNPRRSSMRPSHRLATQRYLFTYYAVVGTERLMRPGRVDRGAQRASSAWCRLVAV